jgi:predicted acylesterase/phospholipase RssA
MIEHFASDLTPGRPYQMLPKGDSWCLLGKYRRGGWDAMLRKYLYDWRLEQLSLPFSSVAVDLVQAQQVIRRQGDAVHALLESINLPFLSKPICRDGMALIDGGILNVVPADVLVSQGSNIVVAVDVSASILGEFAGNRPDTPTAEMKIPTTAQTLSRVRLVQDRNIRSIGENAADLVIEPEVAEVDLADFQHAAEIAALGENATKASLAQLRNILHQMDPQLFPDT